MQSTPSPNHAPLHVYRRLSRDRHAELRECGHCGRIHLKLDSFTMDLTPRELYALADAFNEAVYTHAIPGRRHSLLGDLDA